MGAHPTTPRKQGQYLLGRNSDNGSNPGTVTAKDIATNLQAETAEATAGGAAATTLSHPFTKAGRSS